MTLRAHRMAILTVLLPVMVMVAHARSSRVGPPAQEAGADPAAALARALATRSSDACDTAVTEFIVGLQRQVPPSLWSGSMQLGRYILSFEKPGADKALWSPTFFDSLIPSSDVPQKALQSRVVTLGAGVPFVGIRAATPERNAQEPFSLRGLTVAPVTVTLEIQPQATDGAQKVRIRLWNPLNSPGSFGADLSAPTEFLLQQQPSGKAARLAFLNPEKFEQYQGLFMTTPFQPGKIPVVMVHGLNSLPRTWQNVYNELIADPVIRSRYQFWFFRYPTSQPVLVSSMELRNALQAARAHFDPFHRDKALDRMVLVGHSMGGLLSRTMATESGDVFWSCLTDVPVESAGLRAEDEAFLRDILFLHPQPYVKRIVFIATPHRGSSLASGSLGNLAKRLVKTPAELTGVVARAAINTHSGSSSGFEQLLSDMPTSIDNLSPDNTLVLALQMQPIQAPHHSIIGTQGVTRGGIPITDGVVPYWSAHLDTAESEILVKSHHSAHQHPDAVRELRRILLLHLGSCDQP